MARKSIYPPSVQPGIPKLGKLPPGWKLIPFRDLVKISSQPASLEDDKEYQLVTAKRSRGGIVPREKLLGENIKTKSQFYISAGDFLISRRQIVHGACGIVPPELDGSVVSNEYLALHPKEEVLQKYLACFSHSLYFQQTCFHSSIGVDVEKMVFKIEQWLKHKMPLPPIEEQKWIVEVLEAWDSAIALTEQLITTKQKLKQAIYQSIIPNNPRVDVSEWQWKKLSSIAYINRKSLSESTLPDFEFKYIDLSSVKQGTIKLSRRNIRFSDAPSRARRLANNGDVLMATVRPNLQGFAYIENLPNDDFVFSTGFAVIESKKGADSRFIYQCLYSTAIQRQINARVMGSNYPAVNSSDLKTIWFPIPDDPQKQSLVVDTLEKIDSEVGLLSQYLERLRQQKQGLMQKLLTGEWRVPVEEVAA